MRILNFQMGRYLKKPKTKLNSCLMKILVLVAFVAILMPLIFCGDQISDILYLVLNWQTFGNIHLRNSALAFTAINGIICAIVAIFVMISFKGFQRADTVKVMAMVCFCGWVPVYAISLVMVWGKFIHLFDCCNCLSAIVVENKIRDIKKMTVILTYAQVFLEDIPQLIIQSINNTQTDNWSTIQIISIIFTVMAITFQVLKFMFCQDSGSRYQS